MATKKQAQKKASKPAKPVKKASVKHVQKPVQKNVKPAKKASAKKPKTKKAVSASKKTSAEASG